MPQNAYQCQNAVTDSFVCFTHIHVELGELRRMCGDDNRRSEAATTDSERSLSAAAAAAAAAAERSLLPCRRLARSLARSGEQADGCRRLRTPGIGRREVRQDSCLDVLGELGRCNVSAQLP